MRWTKTPGLLTLLPGLASRTERLRFEARRSTVVTVVGETGTGKEVLARAIHHLSGRSGPYVAINCGSIPRELIQSELFGNVKGAFSGATGSTGYVRDAHQGTLLLDEIVASPPEVQVALLRVLQEKVVMPVGSTRAPARRRSLRGGRSAPARGGRRGGRVQEGPAGTPGSVRLRASAAPRADGGPRDPGGVLSPRRRRDREGRRHGSPPRPRSGCSATTGHSTSASSLTRSSDRGPARRAA